MANFAQGREDGSSLDLRAPERSTPTPAQYRARRNAMWLDAMEHGILDRTTGRVIDVTVADLAAIFGRSAQTILNGLAAARAARAQFRRIRHEC